MRFFLLSVLILELLLTNLACHKGRYKLTGQDDDEQAIHKCLALTDRKRFEEAVECLEIFKSRFRDSTYALDAELKIADNYFNKKDWILAAESYNLFTQLHPRSDKLDYAYYRAGLSYERQMPTSTDRDMSSIEQASDSFAMVFRRFPDSSYYKLAMAKYQQLRSRSGQRNLYVGKFYFKGGQYISAIPRFLDVVQDYPDLGLDEQAFYLLALSYHHLGEKEKANAAAQLMQEKYPNSKMTKKIVSKISGGSNG